MTEDDKKNLTQWLGECWHTNNLTDTTTYELPKCSKCGVICGSCCTFTTDTDMLALFRKLVEKKLWGLFYDYAYLSWLDDYKALILNDEEENASVFRWLFLENPKRSCDLVAEFKSWEK